ncbi:phage distal tail protein [uncultured Methanobrevibacter sp.]|uniref:phage distal tail protein n=1 Tax=uncultured Methanobrevibacter sp. TaxID=253161 RepID=UPI0025D0FA09|nr:phage tail domain-containing protein [uncultured Methanobrevibacter sp.]
MSSLTKYPTTVSQSSGTNIREFSSLANVKNATSYAVSNGNVASSTGTKKRPATITAKNFKFNIPNGSKITKITVEYANAYTGNISIAGPSVDLLNVSAKAKKGKALTKTVTKTSLSWTGSFSVASVNSSAFGVKINYPANTKADVGKVKVKYVRIIVTYSTPNFTISSSKISGEYTDDEFEVKLTCNNKGKTSGGTNVKITLPRGVYFVRKSSGDGSISNSSSLVWNTGIGSKLSASVNIILKITTDGDHTISLSETATSHTNTLKIKTTQAPPDTDDETGEGTPTHGGEGSIHNSNTQGTAIPVTGYVGYPIPICIDFEDNYNSQVIYVKSSKDLELIRGRSEYIDWTDEDGEYSDETLYLQGGILEQEITDTWFYVTNDGKLYLFVGYPDYEKTELTVYISDWYTGEEEYEGHFSIEIKPKPEDIGDKVSLTVLKLTSEETDRLSDGYNYIVSSYLKEVTSDYYVRDWGKNFRMGVLNGELPSLNTNYLPTQDFNNITAWSDPLKEPNTFALVSCEFTYDDDYPVYIVFTGDYPNFGEDLKFTTPTIKSSESEDNQCIFPVPFKKIIAGDGSLSELSLQPFESSNGIELFDFEETDIETNSNVSILGFQVNVTLDTNDNVFLIVKLKNQNDVSGERSILVENTADNRIVSIGGTFDSWGFDFEDWVDLEDWQVELVVSNVWNKEASVTIENIELLWYVNELQAAAEKCFVNGKDTSHYGMFLLDVDVPQGLKTDVKYLENEGTDTNDACRQNITKKEITIKFAIHGCTIEETTSYLRLLGKLFVNKRDELNRPILNNIEFTNYPGEYWRVLMTDPIDSNTDSVDYESTLKLVCPDGTSWSTEETVTSNSGNCNSITKINPTIMLIPQGAQIVIREVKSNQVMIINHTDFESGDVITVDCKNQKLYLEKAGQEDYDTTDITDAVDWHADWFSLSGNYNFECENGLIQTVRFRERG